MRGLVIASVLLALALAACGSDSQDNSKVQDVTLNSQGEASSAVAPAESATKKKKAAAKAAPVTPAAIKPSRAVRGTYVPPSTKLTVARLKGRHPAVVLLPDTNDSASANTEAQKLAALGIGSYVVQEANVDPTDPAAFNQAVGVTLGALKKLRRQSGVAKNRVGIIGEGVGAHVGAVALGRQPDAAVAAVLADIGGTVVPSPAYAPEKWLSKANGIQVLFQRDTAKRAMTQEEITRLMSAAPPGTLMEQYKDLGAAAEKSRDAWIKQKLLAG